MLFQPELWNPHSFPGSSAGLSGTSTPTNFRVWAQPDPTSTSTPLLNMHAIYSSTYSADFSLASPFDTGTTSTPMTFNAGEINNYWGFREPTLLSQLAIPANSNLAGDPYINYPATSSTMTGILIGTFFWTGTSPSDTCQLISTAPSQSGPWDNGAQSSLHFYLDYKDPSGNWITYDDQVLQSFDSFKITTKGAIQSVSVADCYGAARTDPRTSRWGMFTSEYLYDIPMVNGTNSNSEYCTYRPDGGLSYGSHEGGRKDNGIVNLSSNYGKEYRGFQHGYWTENSVRPTYQNPNIPGDTDSGDAGLRYTRDPDGVPRRAMGGYWSDTLNNGNPSPSVTSGTSAGFLPWSVFRWRPDPVTATTPAGPRFFTGLSGLSRNLATSSAIIRGEIWISRFRRAATPRCSTYSASMRTPTPPALLAGRVDLNTRQAPVLQALLSGVILDKDSSPVVSSTLNSTQLAAIAAQLVARTSGTSLLSGTTYWTAPLPLTNRGDLVGSWKFSGTTPALAKAALTGTADPNAYYSGFSADIGTVSGLDGTPVSLIPRQRESVMRALADSGTSRVWNLMIDVIAQSGRYPASAQDISAGFMVEGEKRYWLHVAIDRYTGQVLDEQLEPVTE